MKTSEHRQKQRGYTLLELLITAAIITILTTLSLPAFYAAEQKEAEQIFLQLGAVINSARASAISRHASVVVCPAQTATSCSSQWNTGVLVYVDNNLNRQLDVSDAVIGYQVWRGDTPESGSQLRGSLVWRVFGNRQNIKISELGEISDQSGSLTWCPPADSPAPPHQMVLNSSGRIRLAIDQNGDGRREDSQGRPLVC